MGDRGPADACSRGKPAEGSAGRANWSRRSGTGSRADDPARTVPNRWPRASVPARCVRTRLLAPRSLRPAQSPVSVVDPDDRSDDRHPERPAGPLARSRSLPVSTRRRRELVSELGAHAAGLVHQAGADQERPAATAAVTAAAAGTPLQIMCPRRSSGPAAVTEKTPKNGLEITAARRAFSRPCPSLSVAFYRRSRCGVTRPWRS